MATIQAVKIALPNYGEYGRVRVTRWPAMATGDVGSPIAMANLADRAVAGYGNFNGGTLTWEGFVGDPTNASETGNDLFWLPLTDPSDNFLAMTTPKIEAVSQICVMIRPRVTGGTSPVIDARLIVKE